MKRRERIVVFAIIAFWAALCIEGMVITGNDAPSDSVQPLLRAPFLGERTTPYICSGEDSSDAKKYRFRGTSLGGWLVLEPWITPSLFYQFLGAGEKYGEAKDHVAFDSYTFCEVLGPDEANRQLRLHWQHWVTEEQIRNLAILGIDTIRIPIADWMYISYPPFDTGCWDGALEALDALLDMCSAHKLNVMLDLHAVRGSQNGLDNSGDTGHYEWTDGNHFRHWDIRGGDWAGQYDPITKKYLTVNDTQLLETLHTIEQIVLRYRNHPAVIGLEPVNEPSDSIPWPVIQEFYWRTYQIVRILAPHWTVFFHDSFRLGSLTDSHWLQGSYFSSDASTDRTTHRFLENCHHFVIDTHLYFAWAWDTQNEPYFLYNACKAGANLQALSETAGLRIIVGEWSLATDNCAMWINGLNDNVPGYPMASCQRIPCAAPYFHTVTEATDTLPIIPNAPPNPSKGRQDPFGVGGESYVEYGTCPIDALPRTETFVRAFAAAQWSAYSNNIEGFFFWNFRTELETRWDAQRAVQAGYLPQNWAVTDPVASSWTIHGCDAHARDILLAQAGEVDDKTESTAEPNEVADQHNHDWMSVQSTVGLLLLLVGVAVCLGRRRIETAASHKATSSTDSTLHYNANPTGGSPHYQMVNMAENLDLADRDAGWSFVRRYNTYGEPMESKNNNAYGEDAEETPHEPQETWIHSPLKYLPSLNTLRRYQQS